MLFTKTKFEAPKDEVSKNAQLLIRAGFVHKEMAGVYVYLPLGLRVLKNLTELIRKEMNDLGGQEILLSSLQNRVSWEKTGRWSDQVVDNWFKTKLKNGSEVGLATTHEEPLTELLLDHINSYRDLPVYIYQFQNKFRNEERAKSGILRGREFLMKDLYSFSESEAEHNKFYEKAIDVYHNIFSKVGIGDRTYLTFSDGGSFSDFSHEFQMITDAGEDTIYIDKEKKIAVNEEVLNDDVLSSLDLSRENLVEEKAVEVGNIFTLGNKFSSTLGLSFSAKTGEKNDVFMGCYGIGISRLMGSIVEALSDEKGLVWPMSIAPFSVHILQVGLNESVSQTSTDIYNTLVQEGVDVLLDDRQINAGEKFADSDLIGVPVQMIISEKNISSGEVELKERATGKVVMVDEAQVLDTVLRMIKE